MSLLLIFTLFFSGCNAVEKKVTVGPINRIHQVIAIAEKKEKQQKQTIVFEPRDKISEPRRLDKRIEISIAKQRFIAYEGEKIFARGPVSTSKGMICAVGENSNEPHDHTGNFTVYKKELLHRSHAYDCNMRLCLFYCDGHAIHACQNKDIGKLGTPASHGCIRVHPEMAKKLFEWSDSTTRVIVYE